MVKEVEENPFIPIAWQKHHKGMQGVEYITDDIGIAGCISEWLQARNNAVTQAKRLSYYSATKQLCNRLLEPFMYHKVLVTSTEFENFFNLRCPQYVNNDNIIFKSKKDYIKNSNWEGSNVVTDLDWLKINKGQSEIHMMALAEAMYDAYNESTPKELKVGELHIPYNDNFDNEQLAELMQFSPEGTVEDLKIKIATARCARLSYQTLAKESKIDYSADIKLHDALLKSGHFSPFEHCAKAMTNEEYIENVKGLRNQDKGFDWMSQSSLGWCNNFRGWIQYRYLIENE
jgi:hypothetical protein